MIRLFKTIIIIWLTQILQSCTLLPINLNQYDWEHEWLNTTTCSPPCWEGITPGETTLYDINKDTVNDKYGLELDGPNLLGDYSYFFSWAKKEENYPSTVVSAFTKSNEDMTIDYVQFDFDSIDSHLDVSDLLVRFGEPEYVGLMTEMLGCKAVLLYKDNQVWLNLKRKSLSEYYVLDEATELGGWSYYLSEGARDKQLSLFTKPDQQIVPWQGYGTYPCKKNW